MLSGAVKPSSKDAWIQIRCVGCIVLSLYSSKGNEKMSEGYT